MDWIVEVYGLDLKFGERYGGVDKVYSEKGRFGLKRMNAKDGVDFLEYMEVVYEGG